MWCELWLVGEEREMAFRWKGRKTWDNDPEQIKASVCCAWGAWYVLLHEVTRGHKV